MTLGPFSLDRMVAAVQRVRDRMLRATSALEQAGLPYAVIGGNAVAAWVARIDEAAVRNTQDVDILIRRADLPAVTSAMEIAGFHFRHVRGVDMFLDGPNAKARDAVHLVFAAERVRADDLLPSPDTIENESAGSFKVLKLPQLVQMKLTAFRDKDRTHLRDLLEIGLIDASWCGRYPPQLAARLQHLVDTPGG